MSELQNRTERSQGSAGSPPDLPAHDCPDPVVTILVPTLNEEGTVGTFLDWCLKGSSAPVWRLKS